MKCSGKHGKSSVRGFLSRCSTLNSKENGMMLNFNPSNLKCKLIYIFHFPSWGKYTYESVSEEMKVSLVKGTTKEKSKTFTQKKLYAWLIPFQSRIKWISLSLICDWSGKEKVRNKRRTSAAPPRHATGPKGSIVLK